MAREITREPTTLKDIQFNGIGETVLDKMRKSAGLRLAVFALSLGVLVGCTGEDTPADRPSTSQPADNPGGVDSPDNKDKKKPSMTPEQRDAEWALTGIGIDTFDQKTSSYVLNGEQMEHLTDQARKQVVEMLDTAEALGVEANQQEPVTVKATDGGMRTYSVEIMNAEIERPGNFLTTVAIHSNYDDPSHAKPEMTSHNYYIKGLTGTDLSVGGVLAELKQEDAKVRSGAFFYSQIYGLGGQREKSLIENVIDYGTETDPNAVKIKQTSYSWRLPNGQVSTASGKVVGGATMIRNHANAPDNTGFWRPGRGHSSIFEKL